MSPSHWGPPTWLFFHTIAEKIKETSFPIIGQQLIYHIIQTCNNLPCPDCAEHAKQFWSNVTIKNIKTKQDLINLLYVFHNSVNKRKKLGAFKYENLQYYKTKNVIHVFNNFARNYNTKGNMKLLTESFHRARHLAYLRTWIIKNIQHYQLH